MKKEPTANEQQGPKAPKAPEAAKETTRGAAVQGGAPVSASGGGEAGAGKAASLLPAIASPKGGGAPSRYWREIQRQCRDGYGESIRADRDVTGP